MKIVDQFSFFDPEELNVLLIHLELGHAVVNEWLIIENNYTFQGAQKPYFLNDIIGKDIRFKKFLSKIKIFEVSYKINRESKENELFDNEAFIIEEMQRETVRDYLRSNYSNDDILLVSDADECVDFSDRRRRNLLLSKLANTRTHLKIPRIRFWYDFDNLWSEIRSIPAVRIGYYLNNNMTLHYIRFKDCGAGPTRLWKEHVAFEYSFCLSKKGIYSKYDSFSHTGTTRKEIDDAIRNNRLIVSELRGQKLSVDTSWWLRTVRLNSNNSPDYVRKNLNILKTNIIPRNYKMNRFMEYMEIARENGFGKLFYVFLQYYYLRIFKKLKV